MEYVSTRGSAPPITSKKAILKGIAEDDGLYVPSSFPFIGPNPFASVGQVRMDVTTPSKVVQRISGQLSSEHGIPPFRAGDLRRTCETLLASISVPKEIRAQLLSHGRSTGVQAKHYDRYAYLPEKKMALETWAVFLQRILAA